MLGSNMREFATDTVKLQPFSVIDGGVRCHFSHV
jgi:hypothetical protein